MVFRVFKGVSDPHTWYICFQLFECWASPSGTPRSLSFVFYIVFKCGYGSTIKLCAPVVYFQTVFSFYCTRRCKSCWALRCRCYVSGGADVYFFIVIFVNLSEWACSEFHGISNATFLHTTFRSFRWRGNRRGQEEQAGTQAAAGRRLRAPAGW